MILKFASFGTKKFIVADINMPGLQGLTTDNVFVQRQQYNNRITGHNKCIKLSQVIGGEITIIFTDWKTAIL